MGPSESRARKRSSGGVVIGKGDNLLLYLTTVPDAHQVTRELHIAVNGGNEAVNADRRRDGPLPISIHLSLKTSSYGKITTASPIGRSPVASDVRLTSFLPIVIAVEPPPSRLTASPAPSASMMLALSSKLAPTL